MKFFMISHAIQAYSHPDRHYHGIGHLYDCLEAASKYQEHAADPEAVQIALFFHDVVYNPTLPDNEERSAKWASDWMKAQSYPEYMVEKVEDFILATKHQQVGQSSDARLVQSIDLLGFSTDKYMENGRNIRREYSHVPNLEFYSARIGILNWFLAKPQIYNHGAFSPLEEQARINIAEEIEYCKEVIHLDKNTLVIGD